jgi:hypothetical protein
MARGFHDRVEMKSAFWLCTTIRRFLVFLADSQGASHGWFMGFSKAWLKRSKGVACQVPGETEFGSAGKQTNKEYPHSMAR